jgi:MFS family permease
MTGKFSDYYGRKPAILGGSALQFVVCLYFAIADTFNHMLIARLLYGLTFGLTIALTTSMYS